MRKVSGSSRKSGLSPSPKVAVFLGGNSPERNISLRSGRAVLKALRDAGSTPIALDPGRMSRKQLLASGFEVAFIALHGAGGEDGVIQHWLDRCGIPYTGSDRRGCELSYDKVLSKKVFLRSGIPTPPFVIVSRSSWKRVLEEFPTPFFVKPTQDGSSIGVFRVDDFKASRVKIARALDKYGRLLVENAVIGREFTVGIFDGKALPVIELQPKRGFYDYRAKYTKGMTRYRVPAPISPELAKKMQRLGLRVHRALGLRDFSRVDIMLDKKERPYVLEANAIPGFTELSLLPKAARYAGIAFEQVCARLIDRALRRNRLSGKKKQR